MERKESCGCFVAARAGGLFGSLCIYMRFVDTYKCTGGGSFG